MNVNIEDKLNVENNTPDEEYVAKTTAFVRNKAIRLQGTDKRIYLNFDDTDFPNRLLKGRKEIGEYLESKRVELGVENIDEIKSKDYSVEEIEKVLSLSEKIDRYIKDRLDYIFDYDMCQEIFGNVSSISVTRNGEYYFDNILNAILPFVEKEYNVRINATNERMKKYTDQKGKYHNPYIKR